MFIPFGEIGVDSIYPCYSRECDVNNCANANLLCCVKVKKDHGISLTIVFGKPSLICRIVPWFMFDERIYEICKHVLILHFRELIQHILPCARMVLSPVFLNELNAGRNNLKVYLSNILGNFIRCTCRKFLNWMWKNVYDMNCIYVMKVVDVRCTFTNRLEYVIDGFMQRMLGMVHWLTKLFTNYKNRDVACNWTKKSHL
jgi:hypothetical protein